MLIRCTAKFLKEMGVKPDDLEVVQEPCVLFGEWYAHVFILDRKKQVVFVEVQTLFSFSIENVSRKDIRERLPELFEKGLGKALFIEGVSGEIMSKVMNICQDELKFAKTESRRTIGAMNEFVKHHKYGFFYNGRPAVDRDKFNRQMPVHGFQDGSKEYKFPIDVFAKALRDFWRLDFTPQKGDFIKRFLSTGMNV